MSDSEDYDKEDHEVHGGIVGMADRSCTDIPCCIIFLVYVVGMFVIGIYAFTNGDLRKAHHMYDYKGQLCGVDANVSTLPFAYYCLPAIQGTAGITPPLDLSTPVCVSECPATFSLFDEVTYCPAKGPLYNSTVYADKLCMPQLPGLKEQLMGAMQSKGEYEELLNIVDSIERGMPILISTAFIAFIAGFAFLVFLRMFARPIVYCTILTVVVASIGFGSYFLYRSMNATDLTIDADGAGIFNVTNASTQPVTNTTVDPNATIGTGGENEMMGGNRDIQQALGYGLLAFGVLFLCITAVCCRKSIEVAIAVIEESTNVMFAEKILLFEPLFELVVKAVGTVLLAYGMLYLFTCGTMVSEDMMVGTTKVAGLKRTFEFTEQQKYMLGYWLLGLFWYQELIGAIGIFCIAYATVAWYFTPKDEDGDKEVSGVPMVKGLQYSFQYHMGSLAFGSFIIALCRFLQFILSMLAKQAKQEGNAVMEAIAKCLICIIECFKRTMEFLNKNAYIHMAIHSQSFCQSAWAAFAKILINAGTYGFLNGAAEIIKWLGIFLITLCGILFAFLVSKMETFTDDTSSSYLESPYSVIALAGAVSFGVAWVFMMVFDMVADTLLYCFVDSTDKGSAEMFCPDSLLELMNDDNDRSCC